MVGSYFFNFFVVFIVVIILSVINFRESRLSYLVAVDGYEDANGDYHPGREEWVDDIACHVVPAGKAAEITYDDGTVKKYSYTLNLPTNIPDLFLGSRVKISGIGEFVVLGFHRYQLQCKVWI